MKPTASKYVPALPPPAEGSDDEISSAATEISNDREKDIDSVEYLIILQKIRRDAHKVSQADFKQQFATLSAEFRGHTNGLVEEMNAYISKLKLEIDALNRQDEGCINAQAVVNAASEWKTRRSKVNEARVIDLSGIQRKEDVNEVSELIEATAMRRAQAHRRLLRKVKTELKMLREQEKVVTDAKTLVKRYKKLLRR